MNAAAIITLVLATIVALFLIVRAHAIYLGERRARSPRAPARPRSGLHCKSCGGEIANAAELKHAIGIAEEKYEALGWVCPHCGEGGGGYSS